jgi:CubicO group peptidase (beta-lactamase class C family)
MEVSQSPMKRQLSADVSIAPGASGPGAAKGLKSIVAAAPTEADDDDDGEQMSEATMATAMAVVEIAGVVDGAGLEQLRALNKGDNSFLMDPRLVNCYRIRSGCMPCANVYATARALAKVAAAIGESSVRAHLDAGGGNFGPTRRGPTATPAPPAASGETPAAAVCRKLGFRLVSFASGTDLVDGFCMGTIGGTMVFCVPTKHVAVAITVNQLTASRSAVLEVLTSVARHLRLGTPVGL